MLLRRRLPALALVLAFAAPACGTTASIERAGEPPLEAEIIGGSPDALIIKPEDAALQVVARKRITSIDHPGDLAIAIGLGLMAYGALNLMVGLPQCDARGASFCVGVVLPAAVGTLIMGNGIIVGARSRSAEDDTSRVRGVEVLRAKAASAPPPPPPPPRSPPSDDDD